MTSLRGGFVCDQCGWLSQKWLGRCKKCDSWGSVIEASGLRVGPSSGTPEAHPLGVSPEGAEILCAQWMSYIGFEGVQVTQFSGDGGVDIESQTAIAQVKHYGGSVGVSEIRELVGVSHVDGRTPIFFTSGSYTRDAMKFGDEAGVIMFIYDAEAGFLHPENVAAREMISRSLGE